MKRLHFLVMAVATLLYLNAQPVFAQHGHAIASGHSPSMGHGGMNAHGTDKSTRASSLSGKKSINDKLAPGTKLAGKLETLLPKNPDGSKMSAQQACSGFKNLGQCVAAVHVSHNLGISFVDMKAKMLGTSGTASAPAKPESLGKAIQELKPAANATAESKKANKQAEQDMKGSGI